MARPLIGVAGITLFSAAMCLTACEAKPSAAKASAVGTTQGNPETLRFTGSPGWTALDTGRFRTQMRVLAVLPNASLQLPLVSPNGRWVAYLQTKDAVEPPEPDAAWTGQGLNDVCLWVLPLDPPAQPRMVSAGAAWPVWLPDSRQLAFVSYDQQQRCSLGLYDVDSALAQRLGIGLPHLVAPTPSPDASRIALLSFNPSSAATRLYLYDVKTQQAQPVPLPADVLWQIRPMWIGNHALLFLGRTKQTGAIYGYSLRDGRAEQLATLELPEQAMEALASQTGIDLSLAPDGRHLALYEFSRNRIVLHDLQEQRFFHLPEGSHAGLWIASAQFLWSGENRTEVIRPGQESRAVFRGPCLPRWHKAATRQLILLAPGPEPWTFQLIDMKVVPTP